MKKYLSIVIALFWIASVSAQHCKSFNEDEFRTLQKRMKKYKTDNGRLVGSEDQLLASCLNSTQMKHLASTFDDDIPRAKFVEKYAYTLIDFETVSEVFESFDGMAAALNCYEKIRPLILGEQREVIGIDVISQREFDSKLELVQLETYHREKKERIRSLFGASSLDLEQVEVLMHQFDREREKIWTMKLLYHRSPDKRRFYELAKGFESKYDREDILEFAGQSK